jgi:hypothetical protein
MYDYISFNKATESYCEDKRKIHLCLISPQKFFEVPTSFKLMKKKEETKKEKEDKIKKDFGIHLRKIRESKKLTLRDLDALTGIDYSSIGKSENGTRNTPVQDLYALAEGLEIDIAELFPYKKF